MLLFQGVGRGRFAMAFLFFLSCFVGTSSAQLPFLEGFETDGNGSRYTILDPGYEADTGDSGPAVWGRVAFTPDLPSPISAVTGGRIGLAATAPEKRAAILWSSALTEDDVDFEAWPIWLSLMSWAVDGNESPNIGFIPPHNPDTLLPLLVGSLGATIVDVPDFASLPPATELDLLIHTSDQEVTGLTDYEVPIISFRASNHDDTAIAGIGAVLDFEGPTALTITDPTHPALMSEEFPAPPDVVPWTQVPTMMDGVGKPHSGGKVLATIENPATGNIDPALFVIEKGGGLLGSFDPAPEGEFYMAGSALNKFGTAGERQLELFPVDVSGQDNVKVAVSLAATDADFEPGDYLRIWIDSTGTGTAFEMVAEYLGDDMQGSPSQGGLVDSSTGHVLLSNEFQDRIFDIPAGAEAVAIRFDALNTWGNEIVGIDNIRIFSQPDVACDFDGDGACGIVDLNALLYEGQQNQEAIYDLTGDGTVDLADRDAWLSEAGLHETGQEYPLGDFNFSNKTDAGDLNILGIAWQGAAESYSDGDANGDGVVNVADLNVVGLHWQQEGAIAANAAVPEPALSWFAILVCLACCRYSVRRR